MKTSIRHIDKLKATIARRGFTIVELLIVISIIGILATIGVLSYIQVQANTRDKQRATQTKIIAEALEKYYDQNGSYPTNCTPDNLLNFTAENIKIESAVLTAPTAPKGTNSVLCQASESDSPTVFAYTYDNTTESWKLTSKQETTIELIEIASRHETGDETIADPTGILSATQTTTNGNTTWKWSGVSCVLPATIEYEFKLFSGNSVPAPDLINLQDLALSNGWFSPTNPSGDNYTQAGTTVGKAYTISVRAKCKNSVKFSAGYSNTATTNYFNYALTLDVLPAGKGIAKASPDYLSIGYESSLNTAVRIYSNSYLNGWEFDKWTSAAEQDCNNITSRQINFYVDHNKKCTANLKLTAPAAPTVTASLVSGVITPSIGATSICSAAGTTIEYLVNTNTNDGAWTTSTTWVSAANIPAIPSPINGTKYGFKAQSRCWYSNSYISAESAQAEGYYTYGVNKPTDFIVSRTLSVKDINWSWAAAVCTGTNTVSYKYQLTQDGNPIKVQNITGDDGWSLNTQINTTATTSIISAGYNYGITVRAVCSDGISNSGPTESASSFIIYSINVSAGANGNTPIPSTEVWNYPGDTATIGATPNTGYALASWLTSRQYTGVGNCQTTITMSAGNIICTAQYSQIDYTLTVAKGERGILPTSGGGTKHYGDSLATISVTAEAGWQFVSWSPITCTNPGTMPASDLTCTPSFTESPVDAPTGTITVATPTKSGANISWDWTASTASCIAPNIISYSRMLSVDGTPQTVAGVTDMTTGWTTAPDDNTTTSITYDYQTARTYVLNVKARCKSPANKYSGWTAPGSNSFVRYIITANVSPTSAGYVSGIDSTNGYTLNQTVNITAAPNPGYAFKSWKSTNPDGTNTSLTCSAKSTPTISVTISGNIICTASFLQVLPAPTISAGTTTSNSIIINRTSADANASSFVLRWSSSSSFSSSSDVSMSSTQLSATLSGLASLSTYYFKIMAKGDTWSYGDSDWSTPYISASTSKALIKLGTPTLSGSSIGNIISLDWNPINGSSSYCIYLSDNSSNQYPNASNTYCYQNTTSSSYSRAFLPWHTYYISVAARGDNINYSDSDASNVVSITTGAAYTLVTSINPIPNVNYFGTIDPAPDTYPFGSPQNIPLTATANGSIIVFDFWRCSGHTDTPYNFTLNLNETHVCTAFFKWADTNTNTYTITTSASPLGSGTVTQSGTGTYIYGNTPTLTANPGSGKRFDHWSENCDGSNNPYTVPAIKNNLNCIANFTDIAGGGTTLAAPTSASMSPVVTTGIIPQTVSATWTWSAACATGTPTYQYYTSLTGPSSNSDWLPAAPSSSTRSKIFTDLTVNRTYTVFFRARCESGSLVSNWYVFADYSNSPYYGRTVSTMILPPSSVTFDRYRVTADNINYQLGLAALNTIMITADVTCPYGGAYWKADSYYKDGQWQAATIGGPWYADANYGVWLQNDWDISSSFFSFPDSHLNFLIPNSATTPDSAIFGLKVIPKCKTPLGFQAYDLVSGNPKIYQNLDIR